MRFLKSLLLFVVVGLVGCGFQPRGSLPLAPPLHRMYLQTSDPYGQLAHNLRDYLKSSNVYLVNSPQEASVVLVILSEETSQQLLSVSGSQQTRQYNLILRVTFELRDRRGMVLLPAQTVVETRTIPIEANQILAGSNEANNLYRQMRLTAVYNIMNHLAARDAAVAVMKS